MAGAITLIQAQEKARHNAEVTGEVWFVIPFLGGFSVTDMDGLKVRAGFNGGVKVLMVVDPVEMADIDAAEAAANV